jgi:ribosomal protein S18 acetylase RimI-like enzyme
MQDMMTGVRTDGELRRRGDATVLASFEAYAAGGRGRVLRLPGVAVAVFPHGFEREVYNNAVLEPGAGTDALDAMEASYAAAGIGHYAAWIRETDDRLRAELERRGYVLDTTTLAMGRWLADVPPPAVPAEPVSWADYLASDSLPPDFLRDADHAALHPLGIRVDGAIVTAALAYDHGGDCGVFNVGTAEPFRRRGLGTAVTVAQLHAARARGCTSASLQSTAMGERVYAAAGFRDLGRTLEYVPR